MRKIALLVLAAGLGLAGAASAADLAPMYRKAAPAPAWSWTGCYIGAYVGAAAARKVTATDTAEGPASYTPKTSVIGGYEGGCNYMLSPTFLIGYESETGYMKLKGSGVYTGPGATFNNTSETGSLYSVWAARAGFLVDPKTLLYVKGGLALTRLDSGVNNVVGVPAGVGSNHTYMTGYAVGAGGEYMLDNKWSVKLEYLYLGFDKNLTFGTPIGTANTTTTHFDGVHTGKIGLNYKWDWWTMFR